MRQGRGGEAFVFLNNHYSGSSPRTASTFREALGIEPITFVGDAPAPVPVAPPGAMRLPGL